jgi:hypothetical protein
MQPAAGPTRKRGRPKGAKTGIPPLSARLSDEEPEVTERRTRSAPDLFVAQPAANYFRHGWRGREVDAMQPQVRAI